MSRRRPAVALLSGAALAPISAPAQPGHRVSLGLALDAESVPDAFSSRCGRENLGTVGWGADASLVLRPRRLLVARADAHLLVQSMGTGCDAVGYTEPVGPNAYALLLSQRFARSVPYQQFGTTTARVGLETPASMPRAQFLVGAGTVIGAHGLLPVGVASVGVGTRGAGTRLLVEWEYAVTHVSAIQPRRIIGTPSGVEIGTDERTVRTWPRWSTLRAGVELPLARQ